MDKMYPVVTPSSRNLKLHVQETENSHFFPCVVYILNKIDYVESFPSKLHILLMYHFPPPHFGISSITVIFTPIGVSWNEYQN